MADLGSLLLAQASEISEQDWLPPGLELSHDMQFLLAEWGAWERIAHRLHIAGAEFHALSMTRQADGVYARCRVKRLSSQRARAICDEVRDSGLARQAQVEHLMLAR